MITITSDEPPRFTVILKAMPFKCPRNGVVMESVLYQISVGKKPVNLI